MSRIEEEEPRTRRCPSSAWVSTIARSSGVSGPGFEQDGVGDRDLADVVQRAPRGAAARRTPRPCRSARPAGPRSARCARCGRRCPRRGTRPPSTAAGRSRPGRSRARRAPVSSSLVRLSISSSSSPMPFSPRRHPIASVAPESTTAQAATASEAPASAMPTAAATASRAQPRRPARSAPFGPPAGPLPAAPPGRHPRKGRLLCSGLSIDPSASPGAAPWSRRRRLSCITPSTENSLILDRSQARVACR